MSPTAAAKAGSGGSGDRLDDHGQDAALRGRDVLEPAGQARKVRPRPGGRRRQDQAPALHLAFGPVPAAAREHGVIDMVRGRVADDLEVDSRRPDGVNRDDGAPQAEVEFGSDPGDGRGQRFARDRGIIGADRETGSVAREDEREIERAERIRDRRYDGGASRVHGLVAAGFERFGRGDDVGDPEHPIVRQGLVAGRIDRQFERRHDRDRGIACRRRGRGSGADRARTFVSHRLNHLPASTRFAGHLP